PCGLDDAETFLECGAVGSIDLVVLMRLRAVDAMSLLSHDVHPAALVAARETGVRASAGHMVEHRDILGHANRIIGREHDSELADAQALGLHPDVEIE